MLLTSCCYEGTLAAEVTSGSSPHRQKTFSAPWGSKTALRSADSYGGALRPTPWGGKVRIPLFPWRWNRLGRSLDTGRATLAAHGALLLLGGAALVVCSWQEMRVSPGGTEDQAEVGAQSWKRLRPLYRTTDHEDQAAPQAQVSTSVAAKSETPSPPPPAPTPNKAGFAVQVGAYDDRAAAEKLLRGLASQYGVPTHVPAVTVRGKILYRARLLVKTRGEAEALAGRVRRESNLETWIAPSP